MNWLSLVRAGYGAVVLAVPDELGGHVGEVELDRGTRRAMRILGGRQLFEAGVCTVKPTRCVLALEAIVDGIHAATMAGVASVTNNENRRRAATINVGTAMAFAVADLVAMRRTRIDASSPAASGIRLVELRDELARRICRALRLPAGLR
jgi:hypothetical protein